MSQDKIIIGISGASGAIYGIELLRQLRQFPVHTHLVISKTARLTIAHETDYRLAEVEALADQSHKIDDLAACIASGSYKTRGMMIAPCSMRSLGEIATGTPGNLLTRAADVCLKERRTLVLMPRETPMHAVHLKNMLTLAQMGAVIALPMPAFYHRPSSVEDIVAHTAARTLEYFGFESKELRRWEGLKE